MGAGLGVILAAAKPEMIDHLVLLDSLGTEKGGEEDRGKGEGMMEEERKDV